MYMMLKAAFLFLSILIVLPLIFFMLLGLMGQPFSFSINPNSWLATTKIKWIRVLIKKFI